MLVLERDLRRVLQRQPALNREITAIQPQPIAGLTKVSPRRRVESTISVIPTAELAGRETQVSQLLLLNSQAQLVIVLVKDRSPVHGHRGALGDFLLHVQI